ncbi:MULTISPECIES: hypothetical protein [Enterobacter]|uniref:hypothetical protein n=1 Tax=Enterobacter TaxID=547 RepID=UPI0007BE6AD2|nr:MULTISPECIES: hypothetical protein [Enterobacter]KZQ36095.1 hypothetical protein A3464_06815 [Enterobacter genomosp. O]MBS0865805.1 hypothetical protein [Enterobacter mori]
MTRQKKLFAATLFFFASIISGCSATKFNTPLTGKNEGPIKKELQVCLGQATLLEKIGGEKYNLQLSILYKSIRDTQAFYANRNEIDVVNYEIIAPYYKFRIKDACNNVSIALLGEFKKGMLPRNNIITKE